MPKVELFDRDSIDSCCWSSSSNCSFIQKLPLAMLKEGVERYISNVCTRYFFLRVGDTVLPLTVNEKEYENSYLTSNYYALAHARARIPKAAVPLIAGASLFLKGMQINRVVIINNWLLTATPYPPLTKEQLEDVTTFLADRFPTHLLMFRGLNVCEHQDLLQELRSLRYHTFFSRAVYCYDPKKKTDKRAAYHRRRDLRLMESQGYRVVESRNYERMLALYDAVYREKHTSAAPHYRTRFIKRALETGFFKMTVLEREGKIVGVFGATFCHGTMSVPFLGYEIDSDRRTEVYRILTTLILQQAEQKGVLLNDGSGGERAKKFRGMRPFKEYSALYAHHLPWPRRAFWEVAERLAPSSSPVPP